MKFLIKITIGVGIFLGVIFVIGIISFSLEDYEESKFKNIEISENLNFQKPISHFNDNQIDSLKNLRINRNKLIITGEGYTGYSFYIWHKPIEEGEIFIKAFELTQNIPLSETRLYEKTKIGISELTNTFILYEKNSLIYEGTFNEFYPVRFELWFKYKKSGVEKKLTEKNYIIDGWDR